MKLVYDANGAAIAYTQHGYGDCPMVLLHGFCEDSNIWQPILPVLADIPLLCIDLPGFGRSGQPNPPSMEAYSAAVLTVLDQTATERCILVGHSMGGYVALEFASRWPERLAGLGLFHSHPFTDNAERKTARKRGIETVMAGKRDLYVSQLFPNLFTQVFQAQRPDIIQKLIQAGKQQPAEGIINALQAMLERRDHQQTLTEMACPALFILGREDSLIPVEQGILAALLPNICQIQIFSEVGHMGMWEATVNCAETLNYFWHFCTNK
jgi:pimeloyl-ACP methyl ester carboxylesterase